jgi:hypothetical protein
MQVDVCAEQDPRGIRNGETSSEEIFIDVIYIGSDTGECPGCLG